MTEMAKKNETKMINIKGGMFQYLISFHPHEKNKMQTQPIIFKIHIRRNHIDSIELQNKPKTPEKIGSNVKFQKKVQFIDKPNVQIMHTWQFAHMQARKDMWQKAGRDRVRFERRINNFGEIFSPILKKKYEKIIENQ